MAGTIVSELISCIISSGDAANGPYAVTVTASDGTYSSSAIFTWIVTHTDTTALTMTNPGTQVNVTGDSVNLQINASDPDGDVLTYTATGLPYGLDFDPLSGLITGTVVDNDAMWGPYVVTVTAADGNGQSVSQSFSWIINAAPIIATASPINAVEAQDTGPITVATFTTPDIYSQEGISTPAFYSQTGDFVATINYGDGTTDYGTVSGSNGSFTVTGDHTYAEMGSYTVTITITDTVTGGTTTATTTATVADAALTLTGFQLGDNNSFDTQTSFVFAVLTDANPNATASDFSVSINYGDGTTSSPTDISLQSEGAGIFSITATHNYPVLSGPGPVTYTATVTVTDVDGASASTTSTIVMGQIMAGVPAQISNIYFTDANMNATPSDYVYNGQTGVALINWGDGTSSVGTVAVVGNGQFSITSTHIYAQDSYDQPNGQYVITVTVTDDDGNTLTGTLYVSVTRPPTTGQGNEIESKAGAALNNVQVAAFTVPDATDGASEFSATIYWGDGNSSSGTIQKVGPGLFEVLGSHTYSTTAEVYIIGVELEQDWQEVVGEGFMWGYFAAMTSPKIAGPSVVLGNNFVVYKLENLPAKAKGITWSYNLGSPVQRMVLLNGGKEAKFAFYNVPWRFKINVSYDVPGLLGDFEDSIEKTVDIVQFTVDEVSSVVQHPNTLPLYSLPDPRNPNLIMINTRPRLPNGQPVLRYPADRLNSLSTYQAVLNEYGFISDKAIVTLDAPKPGTDLPKIHLGWVRDVTEFNVEIHYADGTKARVPERNIAPGSNPPAHYPFLDSHRRDDEPFFANSSRDLKEDNGKKRTVIVLDAPGFDFSPQTPAPARSPWNRTTGDWKWVDHLTAYSTDAPNNFVVIATVPWGIKFQGTPAADGTWQSSIGAQDYVILPQNRQVIPSGYWSKYVQSFNAQPPAYPTFNNVSFWAFGR